MFYRFVKLIFTIYFRVFHRVYAKGGENVPDSGGLIICANHIHWLDPILLGVCTKRQIHFMAKAELFKNKFFALIVRGINGFPVKRGTADISAIKTSLRLIKSGKILGIFPEGTRSRNGKMLPPLPGVGLIVIKSKVPVVPIKISGNYGIFRTLRVTIGKPVSFDEYIGRKLNSSEVSEVSMSIMDRISIL